MWTILGQPATSIALPYWPVGNTPVEADGNMTSSLCDKSREIRAFLFDSIDVDFIDSYKLRDSLGGGLWECTFPLEDEIFDETEEFMNDIRMSGTLYINSILDKESSLAAYALTQLQNCYNSTIVGINDDTSIKIYPNPCSDNLYISYVLKNNSDVKIDIISYTGQEMEAFISEYQLKGHYSYQINLSENKYSDGIYFLRVWRNNNIYLHKIAKVK